MKGALRAQTLLLSAIVATAPTLGTAKPVPPEHPWSPARPTAAHFEHDALAALIGSLEPLEQSLAARVPVEALVTYDIGAPPGAVLQAGIAVLAAVAPQAHVWLQARLVELETATGLDPAADLCPALGRSTAMAVLPAERGAEGWPLPRKLVIIQVEDEAAVDRFLTAAVSWIAGAVAPETQGLVGARVVSENLEGVEIRGLQLDGLVSVPLPSPSYALVDGLLLVSSVRSAVCEGVAALRGLPAGAATSTAPEVPAGAVELFWADLPGLAAELESAYERLAPLLDGLCGDRIDRALRTARGLCALAARLGVVSGHTVVNQQGRIRFVVDLGFDAEP